MNAERRKALARAEALLEQARDLIRDARDDEQDYYDNMPDSIRDGSKGEQASTAIDVLTDAVDAIESIDLSDAQ